MQPPKTNRPPESRNSSGLCFLAEPTTPAYFFFAAPAFTALPLAFALPFPLPLGLNADIGVYP